MQNFKTKFLKWLIQNLSKILKNPSQNILFLNFLKFLQLCKKAKIAETSIFL